MPEWTAAVLNRGTPGFAVDCSGALHVSLLRVHRLAFRSLDRSTPPVRAGRFGLRALSIGVTSSRMLFCSDGATGAKRVAWKRHSHSIDRSAPASPIPTPGFCLHGLDFSPSARASNAKSHRMSAWFWLRSSRQVIHWRRGTCQQRRGPEQEAEVTLRCYEADGGPAEVEIESLFPILGARRGISWRSPESHFP